MHFPQTFNPRIALESSRASLQCTDDSLNSHRSNSTLQKHPHVANT